MKLYDATLPIQGGMVTFPGDPPFQIKPFFQRQKGDPFDLALMSMGTHLGTHLDPPAHYLERGATVDELPLEALVGSGIVLDMRGRSLVDQQALEDSEMGDHVRILLKTDNGPRLLDSSFHEDYVHLTEDGAEAGIVVVEGVHLLDIAPGSYEIFCLPLRIKGADGAPARLILRQ
jgi:arylformamidase